MAVAVAMAYLATLIRLVKTRPFALGFVRRGHARLVIGNYHLTYGLKARLQTNLLGI